MENLPLDIVNNILVIRYNENLKELELLKKRFQHLKKDNDNMSDYMYKNQIDMCEECGIYDSGNYIDYIAEYERCLCEDCLTTFQRLSPHGNGGL